jgi:hypothetical protein
MLLVPIARLMNDMQNEGEGDVPEERALSLTNRTDWGRKMHTSCEWQKIGAGMYCKALSPLNTSDSKSPRRGNRMDRIGNDNHGKGISANMSDVDAISAKSDAISRRNSAERIAAIFENCFNIGKDPIVGFVK